MLGETLERENRFILLFNDPQQRGGSEEQILDFLAKRHPDASRQMEIAGGARAWTLAEVRKALDTFIGDGGHCYLIAVSQALGLEIEIEVFRQARAKGIPVYSLGNEWAVETAWIKPDGMLLHRRSLRGNPLFDMPVGELEVQLTKTANVLEREYRAGRIRTVRDLFKMGRKGIGTLWQMGPKSVDDVVDTVFRQTGIRIV